MKKFVETWNNFLTEGKFPYPTQDPDYPSKEEDVWEQPEEKQIEQEFFKGNIEEVAQDILEKFDHYGDEMLAAAVVSEKYNKKIEHIGSGSWRATFLYDNDFVIKVAHAGGRDGMAMNKDDAEMGRMGEVSELFPKVFSVDKKYRWIVMEKATPIYLWEEFIKFFPNKLLPDPNSIQDDMNRKKYKVVLSTALYYSTEGKFFRDISSTIKSLFYMKLSNYDKKVPTLQELIPYFNPTFHRLVKVIQKFQIELQEIRPQNVGFVNRNGKEQFVILDSSKIAALIVAREGGEKYYY